MNVLVADPCETSDTPLGMYAREATRKSVVESNTLVEWKKDPSSYAPGAAYTTSPDTAFVSAATSVRLGNSALPIHASLPPVLSTYIFVSYSAETEKGAE